MANKFDASASAVGYLFQCRWALLAGIRACKTQPSLDISIERFDDVAFEQTGEPVELIQTKHHGGPGDLSDTSVDLWKTIGNWAERLSENASAILDSSLSIITTAVAKDESAAAKLRYDHTEQDVSAALSLLETAASTSTNQKTESHRKRFMSLGPLVRRSLISAIRVYDRAPNIIDVRAQIEEECWPAVAQEHIGAFVDYLEGWWFASVAKALAQDGGDAIPVQRIRSKIDELRENFKLSSLPLMEFELTERSDATSDDNRTFVRQLKLVDLSDLIISNSIRDYYRCSEQRSRWARENLLLDGETERYDRDLIDRWNRMFLAKIDEDKEQTAESKKNCGKTIFHWANNASLPFRNRGELWLSAGAFQNLSDQLRIGWHPEFQKFLSATTDGG